MIPDKLIDEAAKIYVAAQGSVDRPDIIEIDFKHGVHWALEQLKGKEDNKKITGSEIITKAIERSKLINPAKY